MLENKFVVMLSFFISIITVYTPLHLYTNFCKTEGDGIWILGMGNFGIFVWGSKVMHTKFLLDQSCFYTWLYTTKLFFFVEMIEISNPVLNTSDSSFY